MRYLVRYKSELILILAGLSIAWPIFLPGYFSHHDDLQVMRIFEMRRCLVDLQIPCRWVPDMGYGNGFPLFNFYSAFPYYLGALVSFIVGFVWAAKLLFLIPILTGGILMYLLAKELWGEKVGLFGAILFTFAPYRALDSYVRGDVAESLALSFMPLLFYLFLKLVQRPSRKYFVLSTVSLGLFLTTHNIWTMLFGPLLILWSLCWLVSKRLKNWLPNLLAYVLSFGLASFFLLPAFLEKSLVRTETLIQGDLDFRVHFVTVGQLLWQRVWGYGASVAGPHDTISFQVGWPLWWIAAVSILVVILGWLRIVKLSRQFQLLVTGFSLLFLAALFMTHNKSSFIWEKLPLLQYTQFPWRFLGLAIFFGSLAGGASLLLVKKYQNWLLISLCLLAAVLNWTFFKPAIFDFSITDQTKLAGREWDQQQRAAILDYLPKTAQEPKLPALSQPELKQGHADISGWQNHSNWWQFETRSQDKTTIEVPVFDFPVWKVYVDQQPYPFTHLNYLGHISFDLGPGTHLVQGRFTNTPIRTWANLISLGSFLILLGLSWRWKDVK